MRNAGRLSGRCGIGRARCAAVVAAALLFGCGSGGSSTSGGSAPAPATGPGGSVVFAPAQVRLDNPASAGARTAGGDFSVDVVAYDESGRALAPSPESPITLAVYGAPEGTVSPSRTTVTSGSTATFTYDGSFFPVPMMLVAWLDQPAADVPSGNVARATASGARSFGRAALQHANPLDCAYGSTSHTLAAVRRKGRPASPEEVLENGLYVAASVGHADRGGALAAFQVDTGSLGVLVPKGDLGPEAEPTGRSGIKYYDSSGRTFAGEYYLAPVSFRLADGSMLTTPPIKVLAVTSAYCAPRHPGCLENPPTTDIRYLGIGFDRHPTDPKDTLDTPADNVFLQAAAASGADDVSPGYVLSTSGVTIGITSTDGFALQKLAPSATVPDDWSSATGCFALHHAGASAEYCGNLLLDVGISGMFLSMPRDDWPEAFVDRSTRLPTVPVETGMEIQVGTASDAVTAYAFTVSHHPEGPAPTRVTWTDFATVFVNTGRRPLAAYDYLYDARCGNVGFKARS